VGGAIARQSNAPSKANSDSITPFLSALKARENHTFSVRWRAAAIAQFRALGYTGVAERGRQKWCPVLRTQVIVRRLCRLNLRIALQFSELARGADPGLSEIGSQGVHVN
jgi:hypothetical protein